MSSGWAYVGDLDRNVLLLEANGGLPDPWRRGLSGLPLLDEYLSSPNNGSWDSGPVGRCIDGLLAISSSEGSGSSPRLKWTLSCCRSARNWSFMDEGKEERRRGLVGPTEGLTEPVGGGRGDSVPEGV